MFGQSRALDPVKKRPGQLICFIDSEDISVKDVTITNATCWSLFLHGSRNAVVRGVKIYNKIYHENTDGIDIDTCENVSVSDCIIKTGDDAITFRCNAARLTNGMDTCKNVTVTNCVLSCAVCAFRIGVGVGYIRNITVSNISIERCGSITKFITSYSGHGEAHIENMNFSNIVAEKASMSVFFDAPTAGTIKNVLISNLRAYTCASFRAVAKSPAEISDLNFSNIELISENADYPLGKFEKAMRGEHIVNFTNVKNAKFDNFKVTVKEEFEGKWKGISSFENCENIEIMNSNI